MSAKKAVSKNEQTRSSGSDSVPCCASLGNKAACGANPAKNVRQTHYTFRNRDGQAIQLRGDLTMEDLIRMGWSDFRLVKPETPLPPHVWRADSLHNEKLIHGDEKTPNQTKDVPAVG